MAVSEEQEIGDHLVHLLGEESEFILVFKRRMADRRVYTVSSLPPGEMILVLEEECRVLRAGLHEEVRVHESRDLV